MQFGMRLLLACAVFCVARPIDLWAAAELSPATAAFAYAARHGTSELPAAAMKALHLDADDPDRAGGQASAIAGYKSPRALSRTELCMAAASVAEANDLPVPFFANLIQQESAFRPDAVSPVGAQGIAQFMPRVATAYGLTNPFDPIHALKVSGKFLRELVTQFGNVGLAAAAYNAGPKRVVDWMAKRGKLPSETRHYVQNITGRPAERWANRKVAIEEVKLPSYARCPGMPIAMVRLPGTSAPLVKIAAASLAARKMAARKSDVASAQRKPRGKILLTIAKDETASKPPAKPDKVIARRPLKPAPIMVQATLHKAGKPAASRAVAKRIKVVAAR